MGDNISQMKLRHYIVPNQLNGVAWHNYHTGARYPATVQKLLRKEVAKAQRQGCISEREFEVDCFLSVLQDIKSPEITLVEAGSAWGEWCLALAGTIRFNIIPTQIALFHCIAIEADSYYTEQAMGNFAQYNIPGKVIHGALGSKTTDCLFTTGKLSWKYSGGHITNRHHNAVLTPEITIDSTVDTHIDILHMDIQGNEYDAIQGAMNTIRLKHIDYIIIGTHRTMYHWMLEELLSPYFNLVAQALPHSLTRIDGLPPVRTSWGQDGLQLYKRKYL